MKPVARPLRLSFDKVEVFVKYSHGVLSPSPFSKLLAQTLSEYVNRNKGVAKTAIDLGSGSGIQSIVLAKLGVREIYAIDIDPRCVAATEFNSLLNGVSEWSQSRQVVCAYLGDMFSPVGALKVDLIVCNPPSLPMNEDTPKFACGGNYPQEFIDKLIQQASRTLVRTGKLILVFSSLVGLKRTGLKLEEAGFRHRILGRKQVKFRDFYYPHISYYRRSQLEGVAQFRELPNGELEETLYVIEAHRKDEPRQTAL